MAVTLSPGGSMKILWLSHLVPYPPKGGVLQRAYHLVQQVGRQHELDLLCLNQPNLIGPLFEDMAQGLQEAREVMGAVCRKFEFADIDSEDGVLGRKGLALTSLVTAYPYSINWMTSRKFENILKSWLDESDYDVVHIDTIGLASYYKYVQHMPCVLDHHNIESHMLLRRAGKEPNILKKLYYMQEGKRLERYEKQLCPRMKINITCSKLDSERLQQVIPGVAVTDIPNCVDIEYFKSDPAVTQKKSIIFVGTMNWYPNIEAVRFIYQKIWPELKARVPGVKADIIGANPPAEIIQMCGQDDDFSLHGYVDDIRQYIDAAAVYVCPIMDGGGTKLKILDAMAMSKAIVAHPAACEGIDLVDGDDVRLAVTAEEFVSEIAALLDDAGLRANMGAKARQLAENKYASDVIGRALVKLYD